MNQQPIPEAALRDADSVEMLRIWIAEQQLHCSIRIGMYQETSNTSEVNAWGIILADVVRHVANALEQAYSFKVDESERRILESLRGELAAPTSRLTGTFVHMH